MELYWEVYGWVSLAAWYYIEILFNHVDIMIGLCFYCDL